MREAGRQDEGMEEAREGEVEGSKREGGREPDVERRRGKGDARVRACVGVYVDGMEAGRAWRGVGGGVCMGVLEDRGSWV